MKYELCDFGDSTYKLNVLIYVELALDNIKMNGRIHANNLKCIFI